MKDKVKSLAGVAAVMAMVFGGCVSPIPDAAEMPEHGVLLLTFDDRNYDRWVENLGLFEKYGAHASFFPHGEYDAHVIEQLKKLKASGHTVGIHTVRHADAASAFATGKGEAYYRDEVKPLIDVCAANGLKIRSMAYPNNSHSPESDAFLAENAGIRHFRAGHVVKYDPEKKYPKPDLVNTDAVFFPAADLPRKTVLEGIGIGEAYRTDLDEILACVRCAADRNEVLVTFSHDISPDAKSVNMKTAWLEAILKEARSNGMRILGFDELPGGNTL